jgi:hypothetical protein
VTSSSPLAALLSGATASDGGAAVFPGVLAGTITARATHPTNGLHGETTGLLTPGGTLDLATTLQPTGRIAGTVLRREGGVAAAVTVTLSQPRNQATTTGADGHFAFGTPLELVLTVTDATTGDVGQASGVLATAGATANADLTLNGVGTVRVSVRDAGGTLVAGALVNVTSSAGRAYSATTDPAGLAVLPNVLAGNISATGVHATNGTRGTATGTLPAAGQLDLAVALQATGTIRGRVLTPDGALPVAGASVATGFATATTAADGRFEFNDARLGPYTLSATLAGRLRAQVSIALTSNGQIADQDLVLVGRPRCEAGSTDAAASSSPALRSASQPRRDVRRRLQRDHQCRRRLRGARGNPRGLSVSPRRAGDRASATGTVVPTACR